jgi:hypothetical protein
VAFSCGKVISDDGHAPGIEIGRPSDTYRRGVFRSSLASLRAHRLLRAYLGTAATISGNRRDVRIGSFTSFQTYGEHFRFTPNSGHIAAPQRTDTKGPIAVNDDENDTGGFFHLAFEKLTTMYWFETKLRGEEMEL